MRLRILLACLVLPILLWVSLPLVSSADPQGDVNRLQNKIDDKQKQLDRVNGRAQILTTDISAFTRRINALQGTVNTLQDRQDKIQGDLDQKRGELLRTQEELRIVRARLARLRVRLDGARETLAARLVELYKSDEPDIVSVVLSSNGFAELLENGAYLQRIGEQDRQIITAVRAAKAEAATATSRLSDLERRQQTITDAIYARRNEVARARIAVENKRDAIDRVRSGKRALLSKVRGSAGELHEDIKSLEAQQSKIQKRIQAAQNPSSTATSGGHVSGNGRFIWPVNGPITSPFCESRSWENCHPGIDIAVPTGTPVHAGGSGTVIMASYNGGYGNYTCIDHGGGISTCYAHQSAIQVSVGQHVSQGQVIGLSGNTGFSTGPHMHFEVRINGAVTQPLNYLG